MRIGILTQPLLRNYGGVLQDYALQAVLRRLGHEPVTVDYQPPTTARRWVIHVLSCCKTLLLRMAGRGKDRRLHPFPRMRRTKDFNRFVRSHIAVTRPVSDYRLSLIRDYRMEALVVGSDQTWRPLYNSRRQLNAMFLRFAAKRTDLTKVAYAASFGVDAWEYTPGQTARCRKLIRSFDAVSVREASGVRLCREHLGRRDAIHVLDPTLLLDRSDYAGLCADITTGTLVARMEKHDIRRIATGNGQTGYCVAFMLDLTPEKEAFVKRMIAARGIATAYVIRHDRHLALSVEEWLAALRDASLVVTDSFHGTAFSLIFGREFITIGNPERGLERMTMLLEMAGMTDRLVPVASLGAFDASAVTPIDPHAVEERLAPMRRRSIEFLTKVLPDAGKHGRNEIQ